VKTCKCLPGADIDSDHNLLVAEIQLKLKNVKRAKVIKKWNLDKLITMGKETVGKKLAEAIQRNTELGENVEEVWNRIKEGMKKGAEETIGFVEGKRIKKPWITREMIEKVEERRKYKGRSDETGKRQYRKLNNELRRETQQAKEKWLAEECAEIEELERRGLFEQMYR